MKYFIFYDGINRKFKNKFLDFKIKTTIIKYGNQII